jgi:hypothetical protein
MTALVLLVMAAGTLVMEMLWVGVVWRRFGDVLERDEVERRCHGAVDGMNGEGGSYADEGIVGEERVATGRADYEHGPSRQLLSKRYSPAVCWQYLHRVWTHGTNSARCRFSSVRESSGLPGLLTDPSARLATFSM